MKTIRPIETDCNFENIPVGWTADWLANERAQIAIEEASGIYAEAEPIEITRQINVNFHRDRERLQLRMARLRQRMARLRKEMKFMGLIDEAME